MQLLSALLALPLVACADACAGHGAHCSLIDGCCGTLHCERHGFLNWRCTDQCVAEGSTCGGPGLTEQSCCEGMTCERHLMGTANKQCVKPQPQCKHHGQICGCAGCLTQSCCGGASCLDVSGQGGKKYCVDAAEASFAEGMPASIEANITGLAQFEQCAAEGHTCSGPGLAEQTCCDGMTCERHLLGTANKQCVKPQPQCKHQGQICGCAGCLTQSCCGGASCLDVSGQGGKKYCVDAAEASFAEGSPSDIGENITGLAQFEQCVAEGHTCSGPGLAEQTCCDGMTCERHLMGTANKQCVKPQPQCKHQGQICGCVGCLTQSCCGGASCLDVSGQGGKKYCVDVAEASFAEGSPSDTGENVTGLVQYLP